MHNLLHLIFSKIAVQIDVALVEKYQLALASHLQAKAYSHPHCMSDHAFQAASDDWPIELDLFSSDLPQCCSTTSRASCLPL